MTMFNITDGNNNVSRDKPVEHIDMVIALQDPEARSDLGPTRLFGPRLGGASVTTGLGPRLYRASVALR